MIHVRDINYLVIKEETNVDIKGTLQSPLEMQY